MTKKSDKKLYNRAMMFAELVGSGFAAWLWNVSDKTTFARLLLPLLAALLLADTARRLCRK